MRRNFEILAEATPSISIHGTLAFNLYDPFLVVNRDLELFNLETCTYNRYAAAITKPLII